MPKPQKKKRGRPATDRKSTRLNSSHDQISYAVFCLKKKKKSEDRKSTRLNSRHDQISYAVFCLQKNYRQKPRTKMPRTKDPAIDHNKTRLQPHKDTQRRYD